MQNLTTVDDSLVIGSTNARKLSSPTYEAICVYHKRYDFSLEQVDDTLQYMIGKLKQASLALVGKTNVKSVEAKSSNQKQKGGQYSCSYCSGYHKAVDFVMAVSYQCKERSNHSTMLMLQLSKSGSFFKILQKYQNLPHLSPTPSHVTMPSAI